MNVIGTLGKYMQTYQKEAQWIVLAVLVLLILCLIVRVAVVGRKRREQMTWMQETASGIRSDVTELRTAVTELQKKQSGMVYIDNRMRADGAAEPIEHVILSGMQGVGPAAEPAETPKETTAPEETDAPEATEAEAPAGGDAVCETAAADTPDRPDTPVTPQAPEPEQEPEQTQPKPARKYFSRDCGVSRDGHVYTAEELDELMME